MSKHIKVRWRGLRERRARIIERCERETGLRPATISAAKHMLRGEDVPPRQPKKRKLAA